MSFSTSLFKHAARAIASVTVGVLRDVTTETSQRVADALDPRTQPGRHDALARAAERMSSAALTEGPGAGSVEPASATGGAALIAGGLLGVLVAVFLASRR